MDLKQLREYLDKFISGLQNNDREFLNSRLKDLISIFPFNEYEYILMFLRDKKIIDFEEYAKLRDNYVRANKYLSLYGISPRSFGQQWCEEHLMNLDARFKKPGKKLDTKYNGQYDLWIEGIKLEVKASRATNKKKKGDIVSKALCYSSKEPFWMNFQQLKTESADVFVFIGVWVDCLVYWVLSYREINENDYLSHQHRGGIEYQIGITDKNISEFDKYKVKQDELVETILKKRK